MDEKYYMLFYTANLIFILTNIYGWLLKGFYTPNLYQENFKELFPGQKVVAALYFMQVFEIPYLLTIGSEDALFYVNAFSVLLFSSFMVAMCEAYFFFVKRSVWSWMLLFFPVGVVTLYLLCVVVGLLPLSLLGKEAAFYVVTTFVLWYLFKIILIQRKIKVQIQKWNENNYSNQSDFPVRFAQRIKWLPVGICVVMYACFISDDVWVKFGRDVIFTFVNVWFLIYTLNPHRQVILQKEQQDHVECNDQKFRLSEERCRSLEVSIIDTLCKDELFRECHLSVDVLSKMLNTNRNYISEALSRSSYSSFYNLVNELRVDYAATLLRDNPKMKMEDVAVSSGFSSASVFSRIFKQYKSISPSQFYDFTFKIK